MNSANWTDRQDGYTSSEEAVEILRDFKEKIPDSLDCARIGICHNLTEFSNCAIDGYKMVETLAPSWSGYSGNRCHPIHENIDRHSNKWTEKALTARLSLLDHMIKKLDEDAAKEKVQKDWVSGRG